jgi:hypothetical protein
MSMYEMPQQEPNKPDEFLQVPAGEEEGIQVEQKRDLSFSAAREKYVLHPGMDESDIIKVAKGLDVAWSRENNDRLAHQEAEKLEVVEMENERELLVMTEKGETTTPAQESVIVAMEEAGMPQEVIEAAKEGGQSAEGFVDRVTQWATTTSVGKAVLGLVFSTALFGGKVGTAEAGGNYWKDSAKMSQLAKEYSGEQEKKESGNIEYVGFKPSQHEVLAIKTGLKRLVPDMLSAQIRVNKPYSYSPGSPATINMKIDIITSGGEAISTFGIPVFYEGSRSDASGMIRGLFENLEKEAANRNTVPATFSESAAVRQESRQSEASKPAAAQSQPDRGEFHPDYSLLGK